MSNETETTTAIVKTDNGKPALYNPAAFDQIWRASKLFASSDLVPAAYKGKPENCFIAIEMADRMGISPFAMLQSLVIIQGKPSMEAKLIIALVNDSGIFEDPLEYETVGDDPHAKDYRVRCFAKMRKTGKLCLGPWITYQMAEGEGWLSKGGSKWKTMPSIMFMYRAASFFAKVYCPNITMGMQTREELEDSTLVDVTPKQAAPTLVEPLKIESTPVIETVDESTGEIIETPAPTRERGKPAHGKQRRTAAEVEEDRIADEADKPAPVLTDEEWPEHPGMSEPEPIEPADEPAPVNGSGDLF